MTRSPRRIAATAAVAVLLLSACGQGQLRPGAAAIVGEQRITADSLQQLVQRGLSDPQAQSQLGQDRVAFQRQALARLINREVLEVAAAREGITVTDGEVDAQLQRFAAEAQGRQGLEARAAQSGIAPEDLPRFVRDVVLDQELGDVLTEDVDVPPATLQDLYTSNLAQFDRAESRHILVEDEAQARSLLAQVRADPSRFADLAARFSTDTSNKDQGGSLGSSGRGQFVPEFEALLFGAKPGTYDVVKTQFGWHVVHVVSRQTTTLAQATPELRRLALQEQRQMATQARLREVARELGVKVNPRFGVWSAEAGTVEALDDPNGVTTPAPGGSGEQDVPLTEPEAPAEGEAPEPVQTPAS